jgi:hypothetical protein
MRVNRLLLMFSLTVILSLLCGSCSGEQWKSVNGWLLVSQTTVYGELEVTEQWQEVKLLKPLSSEGSYYIVLELKDEDQWQFFDLKEIKNPQGQLVNIRTQLIDEGGLVYELIPNLYNRGSAKFWLDYGNSSNGETVPIPISGKADKNVNFVKLRIKTNHPFTCTKIIWQRHNFK